jgi:hypothetical protein
VQPATAPILWYTNITNKRLQPPTATDSHPTVAQAKAAQPMEPRITIITLGVTDLERSTRFYAECLGLPQHPWEGNIAFFATRGTMLALYPRAALAADANVAPAGAGFAGFTLAHNVGSPAAVDALLAHVETWGAPIVKSAQQADWGGYSGYFADPDGFLWEVAYNPLLALDDSG